MMSKKFLGRMFICVVMLCLCWSIYSYAAKKTRDFTAPKTRETVEIDWKALYPFAEEEPHGKYFSLEESVIGKVYSYVKEHCEFYSSKRLVGYDQAIEAAKKYENIIGWNIAPVSGYNSVVKLHDGYLIVFTESKDVSLNAEAVIEFRDFCHNMSIDFCYMNFPSKVCVREDSDISGTLDFSNQNTDRFLAMLDDAEVRNYDFRKYLHEDGMKHHESFFITDHHWKPETGLWAAKHILRILRDDYAYDVNPDMLNPENFDYVIYPEWFLGSHGKKVTLEQTKPEDISLIYPKFKTHLRFEIPVYNINTSGDLSITYIT